eukprot:5492343-Prymnesium_polylepis.1
MLLPCRAVHFKRQDDWKVAGDKPKVGDCSGHSLEPLDCAERVATAASRAKLTLPRWRAFAPREFECHR